jgi:hypothetical protein
MNGMAQIFLCLPERFDPMYVDLTNLSFRPERADAFSFAFAPANASARAVEEPWLDLHHTAVVVTATSFFTRTARNAFNHQRKIQ